MRPVVNGLEDQYGDRVDFRRFNIRSTEGEAWANEYHLRGHPAFLLLDSQGQETWRHVGVVPEAMIAAELEAVLR